MSRVLHVLSILALLVALVPAHPVVAQEADQEGAAMPAEPEPAVSPEATDMLEQALEGEMAEDMSLTFRPYFFPSLQGGTLTMIGFQVGESGLSYGLDAFAAAAEAPAAGQAPTEVAKLELVGAILQDGSEVTRIEAPFAVAKGSGTEELTRVQSFGDTLAAGTYELIWGVRDTVSESAATRRDTIEVPDFLTSGLTTSSVLLVNGQPQAAPGQFRSDEIYDGVRVLTVSFPDELDRELPPDTSQVMLTYIVVGAQQSATTQGLDIETAYRILNADGESIWRAPPQRLDRPTVGQPIPFGQIDNLEAGAEYVFEITVKDMVGGTESVTEVPFSIAG